MKIVVVCTGNICRSPAMEVLLAQALGDSVEVTSAGTAGMPTWPVSPPMAQLLLSENPELADAVNCFRSRPLTEKLVNEADLILTATAAHRADVLALNPLALRRTMSLGELARLSTAVDPVPWADADTPAQRLTKLVPLAQAARHKFAPAAAQTDDIIDPYGRGDEAYSHSYRQINAHINTLLNSLRR